MNRFLTIALMLVSLKVFAAPLAPLVTLKDPRSQIMLPDSALWWEEPEACGIACPILTPSELENRIAGADFKSRSEWKRKEENYAPYIYLIRLKNGTGVKISAWPVILMPYLDDGAFYIKRDGQGWEYLGAAGDRIQNQGPAVADYFYPLVNFEFFADETVELAIRVHQPTDFRYDLRLWSEAEYFWHRTYETMALYMCLGMMAMVVFQNAFLYLQTRRNLYLIYTAYMVCISQTLISNYGLPQMLFPFNPWLKSYYMNEIMIGFGALANIFGVAYALIYFDMLTRKWITAAIAVLCVPAFFLVYIFINHDLASLYLPLISAPSLLLVVVVGGVNFVKRFRSIKRKMMIFLDPVGYFCLGWVSFLAGLGVLLAIQLGVVFENPLWGHALLYGATAEGVLLSLGIGSKMSREVRRLNEALTDVNRGLEQTVEAKTRDIRSLLDNVKLAIFTVSNPETMVVDPERSAAMDELFSIDSDGSDEETIDSLILDRSDLCAEKRDMIHVLLAASIGENVISFEANATHFPREMVLNVRGMPRTFEFEWSCVCNKESYTVEKILVTCKDVTELREYQRRAGQQEAHIRRMIEIVSVERAKFETFLDSTNGLLGENNRIIAQGDLSERSRNMLYVNLHTVKGAARTLGLNDLSAVVHEAESELKNELLSVDEMKPDMDKVCEVFADYVAIAKEKLSWGKTADVVSVDREFAVSLSNRILSGKSIDAIWSLPLLSVAYVKAEDFLDELKAMSGRIARSLEKPEPVFEVSGWENHLMSRDTAQELNKSFIHLLRNALDHGIEKPADRLASGKSEAGTLRLKLEWQGDKATIRLSDDGRGLNLSKIREIASSKALIHPMESDAGLIAEQIFSLGFSTAEHVTEVSGRGVGMGAVRDFVQKLQGNLSIRLTQEKPVIGYVPFEFLLVTPASCWRIIEDKTDVCRPMLVKA